MSDRLKALREERGKIVGEARVIIETGEKEKRDLTSEELAKYEELIGKADEKRRNIAALESAAEIEREEARAAADREDAEKRAREGAGEGGEADPQAELRAKAWANFLRGGPNAMSPEEARTLQAGSAPEGGYLLAPPQFVAELLKGVDNAVHIRRRATVFQVAAANSLGVPTLDTDADDHTWTTELQTGSEDTAMRFGKRELKPHPLAKRIKISKTLMRASALPIEAIVRQRIAYKLGITQEKAYMTGTGAQQPLGVFTAHADGIPTSRDVSTGNTTTAMTFDGLMEAKYSVKSQYWGKSSWLFHRDGVKQLVKIKDGDGQYIWRQSVASGEPDRLLNAPMDISEYAPSTFTTGQYVGLFGDFSHYWIADALEFQIQRLVELYAETNQDGMIARYEGDGMPVLAEAFARVKLA